MFICLSASHCLFYCVKLASVNEGHLPMHWQKSPYIVFFASVQNQKSSQIWFPLKRRSIKLITSQPRLLTLCSTKRDGGLMKAIMGWNTLWRVIGEVEIVCDLGLPPDSHFKMCWKRRPVWVTRRWHHARSEWDPLESFQIISFFFFFLIINKSVYSHQDPH